MANRATGRMKARLAKVCCCCTSTTNESEPSSGPQSQRPNRNNDCTTVTGHNDDEKFRYSGRNFDEISLDEGREARGDSDGKNESRYTKRGKQSKSKFRFRHTNRGSKNESVYTKTSQF